MINSDVKSNAQPWELEVVCKNRKYLNAVVEAILKYGIIEFEVNIEDYSSDDGIYTVLMWSVWFNNLANIAKDLEIIEGKLDNS